MNVTKVDDARHELLVQSMQRAYDHYVSLYDQRVREFQRMFAANPDMSAADALAHISEIHALDALRLEAAGYKPRPLQDVLQDMRILLPEVMTMWMEKYRVEARN